MLFLTKSMHVYPKNLGIRVPPGAFGEGAELLQFLLPAHREKTLARDL